MQLQANKKFIIGAIIAFLIMFIFAQDQVDPKLSQSNITLKADEDHDGIQNYFDPCPFDDNSRADTNNDGCHDARGLLYSATHKLYQINPICEDKGCKQFMQNIQYNLNMLAPLVRAQYWITQNESNCKAINLPSAINRGIKQINQICPKHGEICNRLSPTLADIIQDLKDANSKNKAQCS